MEFRNLTPFPALNYVMLDKNNHEHTVVVMKTTYNFVEIEKNYFQTEIVDDDTMSPLCIQDEFRGEVNQSQVIQESDLSPFKPACDIIVNGTAHAPKGQLTDVLPVSLTLISPDNNVILNKSIMVTGEREFRKKSKGRWELTPPTPFSCLPIDWQYSFGGECRVDKNDTGFNAIPEEYLLSPEAIVNHPDKINPPLAHTVFHYNPLGCGYTESWYLAVSQKECLPAPRILFPDAPFDIDAFNALTKGKVDLSGRTYEPAGFGIKGRNWQPRLAKAGTYDKTWLEQRHPYLPENFDFSYWNAAPQDQQITSLPSCSQFVLNGFYPSGVVKVNLPNHEALVLLRMRDGKLIPQKMKADTLVLNSDEKLITITWRIVLNSSLSIRVLEVRYETAPNKLLKKLLPL